VCDQTLFIYVSDYRRILVRFTVPRVDAP